MQLSRVHARYAFGVLVIATSTLAVAFTFEDDYQEPEIGTPMLVRAPNPTRTPVIVTVCVNNSKMQQAALLGAGLYRYRAIVAVPNAKLLANPKAKPLPSEREFLVAEGVPMHLFVQSQSELVSGSPMGSYKLESCKTSFTLTPRQGFRYSATWTRSREGCMLRMTERALQPVDAPEIPLTSANTPVNCDIW